MDPKLFDRLQLLAPGTEKYRRLLMTFERYTLSGVMARILIEDDPDTKRHLEEQVETILNGPE
ncbi:MAG TPA: hypothetical protein VEO54_21940 [Thermoanaerobaculia bacterium]|nr:hypothetical protein [Thermoanaerobaculia bacterium]